MATLLMQIAPTALSAAPARMPVQSAACDWNRAARALAAMPSQRGVLMTELWHGPEILWRTGFDVIGAPYEMAPALEDTARFERGSLAAARDVLARRHVSYVLSCGDRREAGAIGLEPMPFSEPEFRLYRVTL
jgi:hypothetical protein